MPIGDISVNGERSAPPSAQMTPQFPTLKWQHFVHQMRLTSAFVPGLFLLMIAACSAIFAVNFNHILDNYEKLGRKLNNKFRRWKSKR